MSSPRANRFLHLYQSDPAKSLVWLNSTTMDITALFTQSEEMTALAAAHQAHVKAQPDAVAELDEPIDSLFQAAGIQIAGLYQSFEQLSALNEVNPALAFTLFTYAPEHIASLLQSAGQFLKLYNDNQALASQAFEHAKTRIAAFFRLPEQFSALEEANSSIAQEVLKQVTDKTITDSSLPSLREQQEQKGAVSASTSPSADRQSSHTNYSFYLKALGALTAIITGVVIIIAALLISQPVIAVAGICVGATGLGFFAVKESMTDENVSNDHSNIQQFK